MILISKQVIKLTESEIMADFDADKYAMAFCKRQKCHCCYETDENGEPLGYGCPELDDRIDRMYQSILKRRMKKYENNTKINESSI